MPPVATLFVWGVIMTFLPPVLIIYAMNQKSSHK